MAKPVSVEARSVALSFGKTEVLRDIDLSIEPGEFFALLGPSGCGKSTLLRLIAGFNRADRGAILIDGTDIAALSPWERNVGMVFQSYALWPHMTVAQNVAFGLEERKLSKAEVRRKVADALALVGLTELGERRPGQLSGGQQQRVALARTLAIEPRVLLLDEPLSNLDAKLRHHMRRELVSLQKRLGITTIFVTHDQEEALTTADRIGVMDQGVIQQVGTPTQLFDEPANRFVAEFIGTINVVSGTIQKGIGEALRFDSPNMGTIALPWAERLPGHGAVTLAFRPHHVEICGAEGDASRAWIEGDVTEREFLGEFVRYRVKRAGTDFIVDAPHVPGQPSFATGAHVHLGVDPKLLRVLAS
jgi:iron(III) transport system ATP-binding protein